MKNHIELDNKVNELRKYLNFEPVDPNLGAIKNFFKDRFNPDIVHVGDKATFIFQTLFRMSSKLRKEFNNDPVQPITITYRRLDLIFYTYDKHPEKGEQYLDFNSDWTKYIYLSEIKMSELWLGKKYLLEQDPDEYYVQVNLFQLKDNKFTKYIKDIDFS